VHLKDADDTLIGQLARLIAQQWPSTSAPRRRTAMCMASLLNRTNNRKLPCHLALTDAQGTALCHAKLSPTRDDEDGFGVLLTSLVVAPSHRRRGLGRQMLEFAEEVAVGLGSSYMALSTPDMQAFYLACGYQVRDHPTLKPVPHVSRSDAAAVRAVMGGASEISEIATSQAGASAADLVPSDDPAAPSVLHKRRNWAKGEMAAHVLSCFHIRLRPTGDAEDGDDVAVEAHTWLRKALVAGDGTDALAQRWHLWTRAALVAYVRQALPVDLRDGGAAAVHVTPSALHWEHQVGDTCGLQALRAARSWFHGWGIGGRGAAPEGPGTEQAGEQVGEQVGGPKLSQLVESIGVSTLTPTGQAMPAVEGADDETCPRGHVTSRHVTSSLAIEPHWGMPLSAELSAITAASVLQTALTAGYTNYGELFDASDLARAC
jgi:GNAT superfamily N-acetyltransferase